MELPKHANQPPIQEKMENGAEGRGGSANEAPELAADAFGHIHGGPRWPVRRTGSAMPRRGAWGWRWHGVPHTLAPKVPDTLP